MFTVEALTIRLNEVCLKNNKETLQQATRLIQVWESEPHITHITQTKLQRIGHLLWQSIALDKRLALAKAKHNQHDLPIVLLSDDETLLNLPWELLYHSAYGFLSQAKGFKLQINHTQQVNSKPYQLSLNDQPWLAQIDRLHWLGMQYNAMGKCDIAQDYLKHSLRLSQRFHDRLAEGRILNDISQVYQACGYYESSLDYLKQSLAINQEVGDRSSEGTTLSNMGTIAFECRNYSTAIHYFKQSLDIQHEVGNCLGQGKTLNNISQVYQSLNDNETALKYLKLSLEVLKRIGDKPGEGAALNNISQIYQSIGDCKTALDYLKQSLAIQREVGDNPGLCATLFNMGHIHCQNKDMNKAVKSWVQVYTLAKATKLVKALDALENLAPRLGLSGGVNSWQRLAKQVDDVEECV